MSFSDSAGVSLLESVLQKRSDEKGSVLPTHTRLILAFRRSADITDEVTASFFHQIQTSEPGASGMVLLQTKSVLAYIECSPESTNILFQRIQNELTLINSRISHNNSDVSTTLTHAFTDARIVCQVEDCPNKKLFTRLFIESIDPSYNEEAASAATATPTMTPAAATNEVEGEAPQIISATLTKALFSACRAASQLSSIELQNEFVRNLPRSAPSLTGTVFLNDERIAAIAVASKLMTCAQWIKLFVESFTIDGSLETTLPLPPKPIYA
jgi:hypothetical protein